MTKKIKLPYKLLIYDIETSPIKAWIWRPGDQIVRHDQLDVQYSMYEILTLAYKWHGEKEVHILTGENILRDFDKLVKQSDATIGKNSDNFDVKHINTQRMLQDLPPLPQWINQAEDLEKQLRRYFAFPSQSLDYIAKLLGTGGKIKMERQDWIDIMNMRVMERFRSLNHTKTILNDISTELFKSNYVTVMHLGAIAFAKMCKYNKKDVLDTEFILNKVLPHVKLRKNANVLSGGDGCITCGSKRLLKGKVVTAGKTKYQEFECLEHEGYAGRATWNYSKNRNKVYGKLS